VIANHVIFGMTVSSRLSEPGCAPRGQLHVSLRVESHLRVKRPDRLHLARHHAGGVSRQLNISVGVMLGLTILGERRSGPTLVGAIVIVVGVVIASMS